MKKKLNSSSIRKQWSELKQYVVMDIETGSLHLVKSNAKWGSGEILDLPSYPLLQVLSLL